MKKIFFKSFFVCLFAFSVQVASGQNYHSKPTAMQNLADELKYVNHQLNQTEKHTPQYAAASEKKRFIRIVLDKLDSNTMSVEQVFNMYVPKVSQTEIQPIVRSFDTHFMGLDNLGIITPNRYIHREIKKLITY